MVRTMRKFTKKHYLKTKVEISESVMTFDGARHLPVILRSRDFQQLIKTEIMQEWFEIHEMLQRNAIIKTSSDFQNPP